MDRLISAAQSNTGWNTEAEKQAVLAMFLEARGKYEELAKGGNLRTALPIASKAQAGER
jgi:hypothetical protein